MSMITVELDYSKLADPKIKQVIQQMEREFEKLPTEKRPEYEPDLFQCLMTVKHERDADTVRNVGLYLNDIFTHDVKAALKSESVAKLGLSEEEANRVAKMSRIRMWTALDKEFIPIIYPAFMLRLNGSVPDARHYFLRAYVRYTITRLVGNLAEAQKVPKEPQGAAELGEPKNEASASKLSGPLNRTVQAMIHLSEAHENGAGITIPPQILQMFLDSLNETVKETKIRFGLPEVVEWKKIRTYAVAPGNGLGMMTLCAYISNDTPMYTLECFDANNEKTGEYACFDALDPADGILAMLGKEYGKAINFYE